ncbi:MAG: PQQ-dependent sugar dehydrogenase [Myxococcales bacterium]|nr:PQQ-dependent sugar dehydrogenase [Myxococcales bacterium]
MAPSSHSSWGRLRALAAAWLTLCTCTPHTPSHTPTALTLEPVAHGIELPTDIASVPGHPDQLVALSKWGMVHRVDLTTGLREDWLWVSVVETGELGLLGIAFDADFTDSGRFWLHLAESRGEQLLSVLREYTTDPDTLSPPSAVGDVFEVEQPTGVHAGGQLAVGPDRMLYASFGDGGPDHRHTASDLSTVNGSIVRLDVSSPGRATAPADNPFVGRPGARPEIWAYGLRNPWRFTLGPAGDALVADVGDATAEELNHVHAGDDLGWPHFEGHACVAEPCDDDAVAPLATYGRDVGSSITGGVVAEAGPLKGRIVFGDFGSGMLGSLPWPTAEDAPEPTLHGRFDISPTAFGRGGDGHVYVADFRTGTLLRVSRP